MKKYIILSIMILMATFAFAQAGDKLIGISIGETNSLISLVDQKELAVINPQLLSANVEVKFLPFFGMSANASFNTDFTELFMYDLSLVGYIPVWFIQPHVSVGKVWMTQPGIKTLTFEYEGQTYSYTYEFNYQYNIKLGVDVFVLKFISVGVEFGYYGNDLKTMIDVLTAQNKEELMLNSYGSIGVKFWL